MRLGQGTRGRAIMIGVDLHGWFPYCKNITSLVHILDANDANDVEGLTGLFDRPYTFL